MPERLGSLNTLVNKLMSRGVPSLSVLIAEIASAEDYADFRRLIEVFLPERELEILHGSTPAAQMQAFTSYFGDRYFPLEDRFSWEDVEGYRDITSCIPLTVMGMSYDDYHEIAEDFRPGYQLMTYLVENPHEQGLDVSLAEACVEHVPQSLLERAPQRRLSPSEAHELLNGTLYEGLALWADRIHTSSGNFFLDTDYELLWSGYAPEWDMEMVQHLTRDWHQAEELERRADNFSSWLEEDLPGHFEELLNFILEKRANDETHNEDSPSG